jgi:hypothetical protein
MDDTRRKREKKVDFLSFFTLFFLFLFVKAAHIAFALPLVGVADLEVAWPPELAQ